MLLPFGSATGILSSLYLVSLGSTNAFPLVQLSGNLGQLLIFLGITTAGGVLVFIGWVGAVLGLWRLGARYHRDAIKIAAFIYIIPYVNIAAGIMLVVTLKNLKNSSDGLSSGRSGITAEASPIDSLSPDPRTRAP
jgi:Protein of unknown function (DUF973)